MSHRALPRWIPACAGMTSEVRGEGAFAPLRPGPLDSRLRGNDEVKCGERGAFAPLRPASLDSRLRGNDELKCGERGFFGWVALGVVVGGVGDGGPADGGEVEGEVPVGVDAGQVCVVGGDVGLELVAVGDGC